MNGLVSELSVNEVPVKISLYEPSWRVGRLQDVVEGTLPYDTRCFGVRVLSADNRCGSFFPVVNVVAQQLGSFAELIGCEYDDGGIDPAFFQLGDSATEVKYNIMNSARSCVSLALLDSAEYSQLSARSEPKIFDGFGYCLSLVGMTCRQARAALAVYFKSMDNSAPALIKFDAHTFRGSIKGSFRSRLDEISQFIEHLPQEIKIVLDCHCKATFEEVLCILNHKIFSRVFALEDPFHPKDLANYLKIPLEAKISVGEYITESIDFEWFLNHKSISVLQPELSRCGPDLFLKVLKMATAEGLIVMPHGIALRSVLRLLEGKHLRRNLIFPEVHLRREAFLSGFGASELLISGGRLWGDRAICNVERK